MTKNSTDRKPTTNSFNTKHAVLTYTLKVCVQDDQRVHTAPNIIVPTLNIPGSPVPLKEVTKMTKVSTEHRQL